MCVEYSYITGLSLIFPLKLSRALVSVCLLGHVSVRKGGWCGVYLALCTRDTLVYAQVKCMWLSTYQADTAPAGPFSITSFCNNHSLNSNHPGVEQIYSND